MNGQFTLPFPRTVGFGRTWDDPGFFTEVQYTFDWRPDHISTSLLLLIYFVPRFEEKTGYENETSPFGIVGSKVVYTGTTLRTPLSLGYATESYVPF